MIKISLWAKKNVLVSRILIVAGYLLLFLLCFFTGNALRDLQILIPFKVLGTSVILFLITSSIYILQKHILKKHFSFLYHKTLDGLLLISTYLILITAYNQYGSITNMVTRNNNIVYGSFAPNISDVSDNNIKKPLSENSNKIDKKTLKQNIKSYIKSYKKKSNGSKTLLIILSVLVAMGLLFGLAALSCSIACSGSGALAILVAVAGTFGIVFGLIKLIERIKHGPREPKASL
jgi:hypothetical protein